VDAWVHTLHHDVLLVMKNSTKSQDSKRFFIMSESEKKTPKQRFIEAARELECDESEETFEKSLERIVPPKRGDNGARDDSGA